MDNRNKKNRSVFEKRGFYTALYSSIGVVLVLAVGLTYNTMNRSRAAALERQARLESRLTEVPREPAVSGNLARGDLFSGTGQARGTMPSSDYQNGQAVGGTRAPGQQTVPPATAPGPAPSAPPAGASQNDFSYDDAVPVSLPLSQSLADMTEREPAAPPAETEEAPATGAGADWYDDPAPSEAFLADPVFSVFTGTEDMIWPVNGEIVMGFSTDRLIHDVTLNQFRTNDKISISATVGTQVRAAADGVVRSVTNDRRLGNTVTLEHGNGWFTTYSQLQDHILVEEGDVVSEGQVIGGVGEPSIFYTLLGSHLSFRVVRNDVAINPMVVLAAN